MTSTVIALARLPNSLSITSALHPFVRPSLLKWSWVENCPNQLDFLNTRGPYAARAPLPRHHRL